MITSDAVQKSGNFGVAHVWFQFYGKGFEKCPSHCFRHYLVLIRTLTLALTPTLLPPLPISSLIGKKQASFFFENKCQLP